jgi:3-oxoadipate enol-lactonase
VILVFVHGAGCTRGVFAAQLEAMLGSHAINLPGHDAHGAGETIADFANAVEAYVNMRNLDDVILCGSSMGGAIALEIALRRTSWLRALVLIGSGAKLRVSPEILSGLAGDFSATARQLATYFYADPTPERIAFSTALMQQVGQKQTLADFRACDGFNVVDRLGELRMPVLAFTGASDVMTPPAYTKFFADRVPRAHARILDGAGHLPMLEAAHATNELIGAFVSSLDRAAP